MKKTGMALNIRELKLPSGLKLDIIKKGTKLISHREWKRVFSKKHPVYWN